MLSQCMADRSRLASHQIALESRLAKEWTDNQADVYTLERDDLVALWIQTKKDDGQSDAQIKAKFEELVGETTLNLLTDLFQLADEYGATVVAASADAKVLAALGRDMQRSGNLLGQYKIRPHNGKNYIVFKGNHRLRSTIKGTRYGLKNPTIVKMGIGPDGLKHTAKGGVYITLIVSASLNTIAWIFDEDFGWKDFLANIAEDVVKAAIAALAGFLAGVVIVKTTGMAVLASAAGIVVGVVFGLRISSLTYDDVRKFAEEVSGAFHRSLSVLQHPKVFFNQQVQKAEDVAYCTIQAAGELVVTAASSFVRQRVDEFLRSLSPLNIR